MKKYLFFTFLFCYSSFAETNQACSINWDVYYNYTRALNKDLVVQTNAVPKTYRVIKYYVHYENCNFIYTIFYGKRNFSLDVSEDFFNNSKEWKEVGNGLRVKSRSTQTIYLQ